MIACQTHGSIIARFQSSSHLAWESRVLSITRQHFDSQSPSMSSRSKIQAHEAWLSAFQLLKKKQTNNLAGYPPPDVEVGDYLGATLENCYSLVIRHMCFLGVLFTQVTEQLGSYSPSTRENIARQWYDWLKEGATALSNGPNRTELYRRVVAKAREVCDLFWSC
jgi:hypothetical protein